jgi:hypothetical protein
MPCPVNGNMTITLKELFKCVTPNKKEEFKKI